MSNLRPFQIALLALFAVLGVLAIVLLSGFSPGTSTDEARFGDRVIVWGEFPRSTFNSVLEDLEKSDKAFEVVTYQQIDPRTFNETFVNAVAEGRSPDLVLLPSTELIRQRSKLRAISYQQLPYRDFRDTYVEGAEIFALADGVYAQPLGVDPLVMYWNRDILSSGGLVEPPTTWEAMLSTVVPSLVKRDNSRNISLAAVALGEVSNILNAKEIVFLLALQSGSQMIYEENGQYQIGIDKAVDTSGLPPLRAALNFYTIFNDPSNQAYSWNRGQPLDRNAFVSGDLAFYFGFGSELSVIRAQNPNLNFDVTSVPQGAAVTTKRDFGTFYGFAIPKAAPNTPGAFAVTNALLSPQVAQAFANAFNLTPVNRQVVAASSRDIYKQRIYVTALTARGWLDPDPDATDRAFQTMVQDVGTGKESVNDAVDDFIQRVRVAF